MSENGRSQIPRGGSLVETIAAEPIRTLMNSEPILIEVGTPILRVVDAMREARQSSVLVVRGQELRGIFTERDYLDQIAGRPEAMQSAVDEHMSTDPQTLAPDATLGELLRVICGRGFRHLPVVEKNAVVGVVAAQDIVKYIADLFPAEVYNLPPEVDQVMPHTEGA